MQIELKANGLDDAQKLVEVLQECTPYKARVLFYNREEVYVRIYSNQGEPKDE